jgi:hypothetical protein
MNVLAVVIACLVAMLTAALDRIPHYRHAVIWNRRVAVIGLGGYLLANAAAGIVG